MTLEVKALSKRVGAETHIYETSLAFAETGFNVLLGATNAGKTTLIKLIAGLEQPTGGEIWLGDRNLTGVSTQKRRVSLVHQFFINYPTMTVYENIASPLRVAGMSKAEIDQRVEEAANLLKLEPMLGRRPGELSGGQQQRTALARAIVKDSDVVLLDEPLANLDYKLREEIRDQLPQLFADRGAVVVYATSEPAEALMLGGHTACLHEGRVTQFGPTAQTYRAPADMVTAGVFSDPPINMAHVEKVGDTLHMSGYASWTASGPIAGLGDGQYTLGVRPHHVLPGSGAGVSLTGTVQITELSGSESVAHFRMGDLSWVSQSDGVHPYEVGTETAFTMDPSGCLFFDGDGRLIA
ncbi:MAG: ABC transporter ATP-binding protein [Pseudomonadota bacterium]